VGGLFNYLCIFDFHRWGWVLKTNPRENRGMNVHELLHYTPANASGVAARGQKHPTVMYPTLKFQFAKLKR